MKVFCFSILFVLLALKTTAQDNPQILVIGPGQMPSLAKDKKGTIHIVFGKGDSILYVSSSNGRSFSAPSLIARLPKLFSFATRGPQIAATTDGLVVTACTQEGNIYSFCKKETGSWTKARRVNDHPETAKEGLMALSADGQHVFAAWLNVKHPKGQTVQGARSDDGGRSWSSNLLVYDSPDGTVCECCKPSVAVHRNKVYVQFRNAIGGNRDLYLATSANGGNAFGAAHKLGEGSWRLSGCPMDGGSLVLAKGIPLTVWRREAKIYFAIPGQPEKEIGEGRSPSLEVAGEDNAFAWTVNGEVIVLLPGGKKRLLGRGSQPQLKALNDKRILCTWENEKQILTAVMAY